LRHLPHSGKVAVGCNGKPRFNDIDAQQFQLPGQPNFLRHVHTATRRLFSIAEGGIEEKNSFLMHGIPRNGQK
jgi:hypothetical protein